MKRMTYVDKEGNQVNLTLERKKPLLRFFLGFNIAMPVILVGFMIFNIIQNKKCINVYNAIDKASLVYLKDLGNTPNVEGDSVLVNISDLYSEQYLKSSSTSDVLCSGTVKVTRYKDDYIYTIDTKNCSSCSVNKKYKGWTQWQDSYPSNKTIVDVMPYYNYYEREINTTEWSDYYEENEISDEVSKYGIKLPLDDEKMIAVPKEAKIITIENDTTYYYRYRDRKWKWYDIEGNYSSFSSERPDGFALKDEDTEKYTDWSEYSQNYPQEKEYREIDQTTGYKYYYVNKKGDKIYYNKGKYSPAEEVNVKKYDMVEEDSVTLYRYRDKVWRWYNGAKRKYSSESSVAVEDFPNKDIETETLDSPSNWEQERYVEEGSENYRVEEKKLMTRYRTRYEILSLLALKEPLKKNDFEKKVKSNILEFASRDSVKLETSYKFRYRKS